MQECRKALVWGGSGGSSPESFEPSSGERSCLFGLDSSS